MKKLFISPAISVEEFAAAENITVSGLILSEDVVTEGEEVAFDSAFNKIFKLS